MILISDLITIASRLTGYSPEEIKGKSSSKPLMVIRAAIVFVARRSDPVKHTFSSMGARLGGRDHSTIGNMWKKQSYYAAIWPGYPWFVEALRARALSVNLPENPDWQPETAFKIHFVDVRQKANIDRAALEKQRERDRRQITKAKAKARAEALAEAKRAKQKADSEKIRSFFAGSKLAAPEDLLDRHISSCDAKHKAEMRRSSERFLEALKAA